MRSSKGPVWAAFILIALFAMLALVAACGGDDEGGDSGDTETPAATEEEGNGDDETPTGDAGDGGGAGDSFRERAGGREEVVGKVSYTLTASGSPDQAWIIYSDGSDSRIDITAEDGTVTTIIQTPEASYLCSENSCIESPAAAGNLAAAFTGLFDTASISQAAEDIADEDVESFDEEIAGEDAQCFKVSGGSVAGQGEGDATWCFAEDGLLLRALFEGGGTTSGLEATEVSRDVSDEDFEPPYDVVDIPGT